MTTTDLGTVAWPPPLATQRHSESNHRHRSPHQSRSHTPTSSPQGSPPQATAVQTSHLLILLPIRVFLAVGWLRAGIEKLVDSQWWNGDSLRVFLDAHHTAALPLFRPVMDHALQPSALVVAWVVLATELGCGIAILIGRPLRAALRWAVVLNVAFVLCGQINPSAFYLVMEMVLLVAVADGTIGTRPTLPTRRTYAFAAALVVVGGALVPFVRTVEPASVITDPAIMLMFLAVLQAATLVLRCIFTQTGTQSSRSNIFWAQRVTSWVRARPEPHVTRSVGATPPAPTAAPAREPQLVSALGWRQSP